MRVCVRACVRACVCAHVYTHTVPLRLLTFDAKVPTWGEFAVAGQFLHTILQQGRQDHIIVGQLTAVLDIKT